VKKMNAIFAVPRQTPATNEPSQVLRQRRLGRGRVRTERTPSAEGRRQKALGAHEARWTLRQKLRSPCLGSKMRARRVGLNVASYSRPRRSIRSSTSITQTPHSCSHAPGRPNLHLVSSSRRPRRVRIRRNGWRCFECSTASQNAPGDTGQLVGERDRKNIAVPPILGSLDPGLEPMTLPALWLDQHDPRRLHEQNAQVPVTSLRYRAQDGAVASRCLLRHKAEPGGEVTAF
jgi:hypothetical protein